MDDRSSSVAGGYRARGAGRTLALVVGVACLSPATAASPAAPDAYATRLGALVNDYRSVQGIAPLEADERLGALAREHSVEMANAGTMSHDGFKARFARSGYAMCVENVGWNYATPEAQFAGWKASPGHDRNLRDTRVEHMGIGIAANYVTFLACR